MRTRIGLTKGDSSTSTSMGIGSVNTFNDSNTKSLLDECSLPCFKPLQRI